MADPITMTMGAMSAAATGLQMAGSVVGALGQKKAAGMQAQAAATAAEYGRARAYATDAAMQDDLMKTLGNIMAVRAAANTNPMSPSGDAVMANVRGDADRNRRTALANIRAQVAQDQKAVSFYRSAGRRAVLTGLLGAAATGLRAASGMSGSMSGLGGSSGVGVGDDWS